MSSTGQKPNKIAILQVPEALVTYLLHVLEQHVRGGIALDELEYATETWRRLKTAQVVDLSELEPEPKTQQSQPS